MTTPAARGVYVNPDNGRQIVLTQEIEYQIASSVAALKCVSDLLCPVVDGVDLHMVDRTDLSYLMSVIHERLERAISEANLG